VSKVESEFLAVSWWPDGSPRLVVADWYRPDLPQHYRATMEVGAKSASKYGVQHVDEDAWVTRAHEPTPPGRVTLNLALWLADHTEN
jgi:hypothetical protein